MYSAQDSCYCDRTHTHTTHTHTAPALTMNSQIFALRHTKRLIKYLLYCVCACVRTRWCIVALIEHSRISHCAICVRSMIDWNQEERKKKTTVAVCTLHSKSTCDGTISAFNQRKYMKTKIMRARHRPLCWTVSMGLVLGIYIQHTLNETTCHSHSHIRFVVIWRRAVWPNRYTTLSGHYISLAE